MILTPGSPALDVLNSRPQQRLDQGRMNTFWIGLHEPVRLFMASPYFMARKISLRFLVLLDPSYKRTDRNGEGHEWGQWFTIHARHFTIEPPFPLQPLAVSQKVHPDS